MFVYINQVVASTFLWNSYVQREMRENCDYVFTSVGLYIRLSSVLYIRGLSLERRLRFGPKANLYQNRPEKA